MDEHSLSAQLKRSGSAVQHRVRLLAYCLHTTKLRSCLDTTTQQSDNTARHPIKRPDDADDTENNTRLSLANVLFVLRDVLGSQASTSLRSQSCVGPPRFVFGVGPKGAVVRSADRGTTWRALRLPTSATELPVAPTKEEEAPIKGPAKKKGGDDEGTLSEIIGLLPDKKKDESSSDEDDSGSDGEEAVKGTAAPNAGRSDSPPPAAPTGPSDLHSVDTTDDGLVVVCGSDGYLAISADRGVRFTVLPLSCAAVLKDRTKSKRQYLTIQKVRFLGKEKLQNEGATDEDEDVSQRLVRQRLVLHTSYTLLSCCFDWQPSTQQVVYFRPLELLHRFQSPIGGLAVTIETDSVCSITVTVNNVLFLSFDDGRSLIPCPHRLGIIRDMVAVPYGSNTLAPFTEVTALQLPSPQTVLETLQSIQDSDEVVVSRGGDKASGDKTVQRTQPKYVYDVTSCVMPQNKKNPMLVAAAATQEVNEAVLSQFIQRFRHSTMTTTDPSAPSVLYRAWFVLSTEGKVVPYDCTSILFVAIEPQLQDDVHPSVRMVTMPRHVDYLAFTQSGVVEKVGLEVLVQRCPRPSPPTLVWLRSTSSGVSLSMDMGLTWTTPEKSFTGTVVELDEGCVCVATMRRTVLIGKGFAAGAALESVMLPTSLKISSVVDLAVMR